MENTGEISKPDVGVRVRHIVIVKLEEWQIPGNSLEKGEFAWCMRKGAGTGTPLNFGVHNSLRSGE